jgi:elongation factor 2
MSGYSIFREYFKMADPIEKINKLMKTVENIRNIAIAAHIDHGKTTFSDNLLAGAGMMSQETAGEARALDFHQDETERGITIDSANVSMIHNVGDVDYLINLIDTPGHVDFGGDVTRAMRAVDGAIVLVCASEGIMPQTETVLRQALKERVKPVLFINKVDRLIREVKLTPEQMQERFLNVISKVNDLIEKIAEPEFKNKWKVNVKDGSVAFGSAFHKWAMSVPYMQKKNLSFKEIIDAYSGSGEEYKELSNKAPLHEVVLDMVINHHPNPKSAQEYRIPKIWHGDKDSKIGQDLITCNSKGAPAFICTKIVIDKNAGEVAAGRLFSGTLKKGEDVYMNLAKKKVNLQQVSIYKGAQRVQLGEVIAGNVVGLVGLRGVFAGETVSKEEIEPFEAIKHIFEPVVTKSIEATKAADLPKLIEILRQVGKEDPSVKIEINEETGENLISGMGELHLEVLENRIKTEKNLAVKTGPPIIVYRETISKESETPVESRSPNGHNILYFSIEPLEDEVYEAIQSGEIPEKRLKKKDEDVWATLSEKGLSNDEARQIKDIYKGNVFEDRTRGIVLLNEIIDSVMDGWKLVVDGGPLAKEPLMKSKVILHDAKIHVDSVHRGPGQIYPAVRAGVHESMKKANPSLLEPVQTHQVEAPVEFMGAVTSLISGKRGVLEDVQQDEDGITIKAKIPVNEMIGWSNDLRSATEGRGVSSLVEQTFQKLPGSLQEDIIKKTRDRKGLSANQ